MDRIACFLIEPTGEMTPFVEGLSSPIYRRVDDVARLHTGWGDRYDVPPAPAGAMWVHPTSGLVVRTPGGDWHVDLPSRSGSPWSRRGTPPMVVASPSILFAFDDPVYLKHGVPMGHRKYHGFLGGPGGEAPGVLVEC